MMHARYGLTVSNSFFSVGRQCVVQAVSTRVSVINMIRWHNSSCCGSRTYIADVSDSITRLLKNYIYDIYNNLQVEDLQDAFYRIHCVDSSYEESRTRGRQLTN
ncbi:unnamed protein product [Amoebophrya sp. A25]|nr:unnamed protein product [Amoebophrya sp. A25]|eukprot:GSA25T00015280001.1